MNSYNLHARLFVLFTGYVVCQAASPGSPVTSKNIPPYIKQCREADPKLSECIIQAVNHLRPYLVRGIPDIQLPSVEPFRMEPFSLALATGPDGYKITLRDIDLRGASNFTITKLKLSRGSQPFEAKIRIPALVMDSHYSSSGVLIVIPASGNGTFHADFGDILATVKGYMSTVKEERTKRDYFHLDKLDLDLNIKKARMSVSKVFNNNKILVEATNLFLEANGQEVLQAMMPQLRGKLSNVFKGIVNQLLSNVPRDVMVI
ncbi:unnamed protein product [Bemisia tabaci]|uniref:Circadian clock-controlled protein n=1 Tax=Bemisia tabaci TaxID=7038 RepID=A0A9P0F9K8_BEMTA|nr:PREDICTED: uncharacterized protein LOC109039388 [Bemisia tabaci]CAH0393933.1 unnamed protein product [Bemisia tabaci]